MLLEGSYRSYFGAIAVPVIDKGDGTISNVTHEWAVAAGSLGGGLAVTVLRLQIRNYRVDIAKQKLAEMALKNNCQWILFLDDDVIPPGDSLMKMITLWRSDPKYKIINGIYWSKSDPSFPLIFSNKMEGSLFNWKTTDLIQADFGGAGLTFIDTEVFKKMSKPWFSCEYYFDNPYGNIDVEKWALSDALGDELMKGPKANPVTVKQMEDRLKELGQKHSDIQAGKPDPEYYRNKRKDGQTTEDLYFYKKAKEELGISPWFDCSIQAEHQDKRTGKTWGLRPGMDQAMPRFAKKLMGEKPVVVEVGEIDPAQHDPRKEYITISDDPLSYPPDVIGDPRWLRLDDCIADELVVNRQMERTSSREIITVLHEWLRVLKVGGKVTIIGANLKWAANKLANEKKLTADEQQRIMFMYYSAQMGDLKQANDSFHKSGYTQESLKALLSRIDELAGVQVVTTDGNIIDWEAGLHEDGLGYNIIAFATKKKNIGPVSLSRPIKEQEEAMQKVGQLKELKKAQKGKHERKVSDSPRKRGNPRKPQPEVGTGDRPREPVSSTQPVKVA